MSDVRVPQAEQMLTGIGLIRGGPKVAMCRVCENEPLVATFHWSKKEFICLGCGRLYEWLEPRAAEETSELIELSDARTAEWEENAGALLDSHSWRADCKLCEPRHEYHCVHATQAELAAHERAAAWVLERTGRPA